MKEAAKNQVAHQPSVKKRKYPKHLKYHTEVCHENQLDRIRSRRTGPALPSPGPCRRKHKVFPVPQYVQGKGWDTDRDHRQNGYR